MTDMNAAGPSAPQAAPAPISSPASAQPAPSTSSVAAQPAAAPAAPQAPPLTGREAFRADIQASLARARDASGKFISTAQAAQAAPAQAAPAQTGEALNPNAAPVVQTANGPAVDFSAFGLGRVPLDQAPQMVQSIIAHQTRETANKLAAAEQRAAKLAEADQQLNEMIRWGQQDPQGLANFLNSAQMRGAARQAPQGAPQQFQQAPQAAQGQQPRYLTAQEAQDLVINTIAQREAAAKAASDQQAAQAAEYKRLNDAFVSTIAPIIQSESPQMQSMIRTLAAARLMNDARNIDGLPEPMFIQRAMTEAQAVRDELRAALASSVAAQAQITQNAPPPVVGGGNMVPREERFAHPLDRSSIRESFAQDLARMRGM